MKNNWSAQIHFPGIASFTKQDLVDHVSSFSDYEYLKEMIVKKLERCEEVETVPTMTLEILFTIEKEDFEYFKKTCKPFFDMEKKTLYFAAWLAYLSGKKIIEISSKEDQISSFKLIKWNPIKKDGLEGIDDL